MTTSYNDGSHDPVTGEYIKPEDRVQVSVGTSFDYNGTEYVSAGSTASYTVSTAGTAYDDPAYYASEVDYSVSGMGTGVYNVDIPTHDHSDLHQHLHDLVQKVDELNRKVDHLLEHAHQPLYGTVNIEPPAKVGAGYTV